MPGPAPSRNPRRQNARPEWRRLPAGGRSGKPPAWPLAVAMTKNESELWTQLWASPQAEAWEALGWFRVVARYTRVTIAAEKRGAAAALLAEVRQLEDRLGLNPMSMRRLLWEITEAESTEVTSGEVANISEYRDRLS